MRASYRFARAFGWTPQQMQALTMAQVTMYLHLLDEEVSNSDGR